MDAILSPQDFQNLLESDRPPLLIDVRVRAAYRNAAQMIAGALRREPDSVTAWEPTLPASDTVVVYSDPDGAEAQRVAQALAERGRRAHCLGGGLAAWQACGGPLLSKPRGASTRWVTRERPKIDRIACPWLVARFIDAEAEFDYVPPADVLKSAAARDAIPYDIPDVPFSHVGECCSFDAFIAAYRLADPALRQLAVIVRGADTACLDLAPQAAGLAAISLGLSRRFVDDHEMLGHGMVLYDALYLWCKEGQDERHTWNPEAYRAA